MRTNPNEDLSAAPRKTISPSFDRWQGWFVILLCLFVIPPDFYLVHSALSSNQTALTFIFVPALISLLFAGLVKIARAATWGGLFAGTLICFTIIAFSVELHGNVAHSLLPALMLLFVLTTLATRIKRAQKEKAGLAESRHGRTAGQVFANLGMAALTLTPLLYNLIYRHMRGGSRSSFEVGIITSLAALAEATADTVSSEIGQAIGGSPILVTTLRRVAPGTDGAISLKGTLMGIAAAILVTYTGIWSMGGSFALMLTIVAAACIGFFADTLIGATLERAGWLGNNAVNFISTGIAALSAAFLLQFLA